MLYTEKYRSPLGGITLLGDAQYLYGLWFDGQKHFGAYYDLTQSQIGHPAPIQQALAWLDQYFAGKNPDANSIPLKPEVTAFRQRVLQVLRTVPYGKTITYKGISDALQTPDSHPKNLARAVGGAVGHNPISIIIPCHRVVGSNGALTGYAGGLAKKIALLKLETR